MLRTCTVRWDSIHEKGEGITVSVTTVVSPSIRREKGNKSRRNAAFCLFCALCNIDVYPETAKEWCFVEYLQVVVRVAISSLRFASGIIVSFQSLCIPKLNLLFS